MQARGPAADQHRLFKNLGVQEAAADRDLRPLWPCARRLMTAAAASVERVSRGAASAPPGSRAWCATCAVMGALAGTARFSAAFHGDAADTAGAAERIRSAFATPGGKERSARLEKLRLGVGQDRAREIVRQQMKRMKCASRTRAAAAVSVGRACRGAASATPGSRA